MIDPYYRAAYSMATTYPRARLRRLGGIEIGGMGLVPRSRMEPRHVTLAPMPGGSVRERAPCGIWSRPCATTPG